MNELFFIDIKLIKFNAQLSIFAMNKKALLNFHSRQLKSS